MLKKLIVCLERILIEIKSSECDDQPHSWFESLNEIECDSEVHSLKRRLFFSDLNISSSHFTEKRVRNCLPPELFLIFLIILGVNLFLLWILSILSANACGYFSVHSFTVFLRALFIPMRYWKSRHKWRSDCVDACACVLMSLCMMFCYCLVSSVSLSNDRLCVISLRCFINTSCLLTCLVSTKISLIQSRWRLNTTWISKCSFFKSSSC